MTNDIEYHNLVKALVNSSEGEEDKILAASSNLLDENLTEYLLKTAEDLRREGNLPDAERLLNLANKLLTELPTEIDPNDDYISFWLNIFQAVSLEPNREVIYFLLKDNIDKLNAQLGLAIKNWSNTTFKLGDSENREEIVAVICTFSNLIQEFPLGEKAANLEIARQGYETALTVYSKEKFPEQWARTQNNLGYVYYQRIKGGPAGIRFAARKENIELAITAYEKALSILSKPVFPQDWAKTQANLAKAYRKRIKGERSENLELAIAAGKKALSVLSKETAPQWWCKTHYHMARAYYQRIKGVPEENQEQEISAYLNCLQVLTQEKFLADWVRIQNSLAKAYENRIRGHKGKNMEEAIAAYEQTLSVITEDILPQDWAKTQYNLATAYRNRQKGDKAENMEKAITVYESALRIYTEEEYPQEWGKTQNNLGNAYYDRIVGNQAENLEKAIAAYKSALRIRTRDERPEAWAKTLNNLGNAYRKRVQGDKAQNLQWAIYAYKQALEVRTPEKLPLESLISGSNLGDVAFATKQWPDSYEGYDVALKAIEQLYAAAPDNKRRVIILTKAVEIYRKRIQAGIYNGKDIASCRNQSLEALMAKHDLNPGLE